MLELNRSHAVIEDGKITIDENILDIFDCYETPIPDWQPSTQIKPFRELKGLSIDIETEGLDPSQHRIMMIGLINEKGEITTIDSFKNEKLALLKLFAILKDDSLEYLTVFNGIRLTSHKNFGFDFWFIHERCKLLGLQFPFWIAPNTTCFRTAQINSVPITFHHLWLNYGKTAVFDLYHQLLAWDFVARKLTAHNLKQAPLQLGLRKDDRLELSYEELTECYRIGDWDRVRQYLEDDLRDTKLLADTLLPAIWGQKLYLPDWKFQTLGTAGNGSKWNDIMIRHYGGNKPETSPTLQFKGALTFAKPGLFRNCIKLDVESLYPHIMLLYGIHSEKDTEGFLLMILNYLLKYRLSLKKKKEDGTITQDDKNNESTAKVMINSGYGGLATGGIEYNDMIAAAYVTAYGRAIFKFIFKTVEDLGHEVIQADTDGLIISLKNRDMTGKQIEEYVNNLLPKNEHFSIRVKYEWDKMGDFGADAVYVPKNLKTEDALRKTYLVFSQGECKTKKGRYRKRDRSVLDKDFQIDFLLKIIYGSLTEGLDFVHHTIEKLKSGEYPIEELQITRKIKVNEKTLVELGIGEAGSVQTFYEGLEGATKNGEYNPEFYLQKVYTLFAEVMDSL